MATDSIDFPTRPLGVRPPGYGWTSSLWSIFFALLMLGAFVLITIPPIPDLLTDWSIHKTAVLLPAAGIEDGECSTRLVLVDCHGKLVSRGLGGGAVSHDFSYYFVDLKFGDYSAEVMGDPARPDYLTTDLALDKLWNRTITLVLSVPLFGSIAWAALAVGVRQMRTGRRIKAALNGRPLHPVPLRLEGRGQKQWRVLARAADGGAQSQTWQVSLRARPIFLNAEQALILGVTADGEVTMPLDSKLRWLDLTRAERDALLKSLPPQPAGK